MKILQVSTTDIGGGAESVAWRLFTEYQRLGHDSWLAVGLKHTKDPDVLLTQQAKPSNLWFWLRMRLITRLRSPVSRIRGGTKAITLLEHLVYPSCWLQQRLGHDVLSFPETWHLLNLPPAKPDVIHCHNLHGPFVPRGGYFDLRALPWLSRQAPVVLTLHDAWLASGHCSYSFDCERWKTGCGHCPDLSIYPAIRRDATAFNWRLKQRIYTESRLCVVTPSRWLMQEVEQSILAPAAAGVRVIPNGVDLSSFHPANKQAVRKALGLPLESKVLLFVANTIRKNVRKDYETVQAAVAQVAERLGEQSVLSIALGESAPTEQIGRAEVRFVPYQKDPQIVARYYQAADVYIHAARADNFPLTVLEALACGTPVVATAVGGIPEQIKPLPLGNPGLDAYAQGEATGLLVPPRDADGMATAVAWLLSDEVLRCQLGENAAGDARRRFGLETQVMAHLDLYREILERRNLERSTR
jgi:glycosyltransferase involved in cell wall biosynthesis